MSYKLKLLKHLYNPTVRNQAQQCGITRSNELQPDGQTDTMAIPLEAGQQVHQVSWQAKPTTYCSSTL